ncbi:hypothetical protein ABFW14_00680 [Mycolicibacterium fortuitum]|uniref:hypothetical protein n=1 Tax=Mycolicibacterium fortuitum TaxID=1766 RepID=UPI0007EC33DA|nr:hypothetical protein [Mycolicibacterium fortuitum]OBK11390.1 hypothetical protein A5637_24260 [Mycolicibacterium fortuitum]
MIKFALRITADSSITPDELARAALPEVISILEKGAHSVGEPTVLDDDHQRSHLEYALEPGPARLTVDTDYRLPGGIEFVLSGRRFGRTTAADHDRDQALWMRLIVLGVTLADLHQITHHTSDPDLDAGR